MNTNRLAINGHAARYQHQPLEHGIRPYGQPTSANGYLPDNRIPPRQDNTVPRSAAYMGMPLANNSMNHPGSVHHQDEMTYRTGKEHEAQTHLTGNAGTDSLQSFSQSEISHEDHSQRVLSPSHQTSLQYHSQYAGYESYHHRPEMESSDARHQVAAHYSGNLIHQLPQEWTTRRQSGPPLSTTTGEQRAMYRYHEVEGQNGYIR
jgi:hypothetical protein